MNISKFLPDMDKWIIDHYINAVDLAIQELGDVSGKDILDVGCGEMLMSFGLAAKGAAHVTGLDISPLNPNATINRLIEAGFPDVVSIRDRVSALVYDGITMPLPDASFDVIFCWGVMEHVSNIPSVLSEMKRVLRPGGVAFIKVFPWFHSIYGSHLSDFNPIPFAHLTHSTEQMRVIVEEAAPRQTLVPPSLILNHMWPEFLTLNRYSADMFYRDVKAAGFSRDVWKLTSGQHDLTAAPAAYNLSELMISGTETLLYR